MFESSKDLGNGCFSKLSFLSIAKKKNKKQQSIILRSKFIIYETIIDGELSMYIFVNIGML